MQHVRIGDLHDVTKSLLFESKDVLVPQFLFCLDLPVVIDDHAIVANAKTQHKEAENVKNGDQPVFVPLLLDQVLNDIVDDESECGDVDYYHAACLDGQPDELLLCRCLIVL